MYSVHGEVYKLQYFCTKKNNPPDYSQTWQFFSRVKWYISKCILLHRNRPKKIMRNGHESCYISYCISQIDELHRTNYTCISNVPNRVIWVPSAMKNKFKWLCFLIELNSIVSLSTPYLKFSFRFIYFAFGNFFLIYFIYLFLITEKRQYLKPFSALSLSWSIFASCRWFAVMTNIHWY